MNEKQTSIWKRQFLPKLSPARFLRWLFSWRIIRRCLVALAFLVTLVALFYAEENWRGKHAWENFKREWEAKGEKFELKEFIPPPVPDEQNFAMTPFLAPLFDFKIDPKVFVIWRDTNAYQKVNDFGTDIGWLSSNGFWTAAQRVDLTAWSAALDAKKNVPGSGESMVQRAESADVVLRQMEKFKPVLEELRIAGQRPCHRFNIKYLEGDPANILLPHLAVMRKFAMIFSVRSSAELAAGRSDDALADEKMTLYLAEAIKNEPYLISGLVRLAMLKISLQPIWEGLADHRWSDAHVMELQTQLERLDLLKDCGAAMRGERAFNNAGLDYKRQNWQIEAWDSEGNRFAKEPNFMPAGWYYQNEVNLNRIYQEVIMSTVDDGAHFVNVSASTSNHARINQELNSGFMPYKIFAALLFPAINGSDRKYAVAQVGVDEAIIACTLERYRLVHGQFPETLDALAPQFIAKLPPDVITGKPLIYRRTEDGQFILYSVGWNEKDDGGTVVMTKSSTPSVDTTQGDWVWRYPSK